MAASGIAGIRSAYDLARGLKLSEVDKANQAFIAAHTYNPQDPESQGLIRAFESSANPLNWPAKIFDKLGDTINEATGSTAAGPIVSGALQVATGAGLPYTGRLRGVKAPQIPSRTTPGWGPEAPQAPPATATAGAGTAAGGAASAAPAGAAAATAQAAPLSATGAPRPAFFEPQDIPGKPGVAPDTEPVTGGLPATVSKDRMAVLNRIGLDTARSSALEGDAMHAATDWQMTRFDAPAGAAAKAQFDAERAALENHARGIVEKAGGTLGTDEDALNARGQTIAKPFDDFADWFETQRKKLYAAADQRAAGAPVVQLQGLRAMLDDPSFNNQLTARDLVHVRNGISAELDRFQANNPQGLTMQNAEQFRQFLNTAWTPETSSIIGRLKGALDDDVMRGAGEDLYGPARKLAALEKQTLQNPSGIFQLMERDPQTPINRTTAFNKIPDTVTRLSPDQFSNIVNTLRSMPEELQPQAQAALGEIRSHLANKIYDAGNSTAGQWNARGVEGVIKANSAKLRLAFSDQPELLGDIADLRSAGKILSVNQSYPGAAAQAANALKRGVLPQLIGKAAASMGAAAGGLVAGPLGAAGGAMAGEELGARAGMSIGEHQALKKWQGKTVKLSDVLKP